MVGWKNRRQYMFLTLTKVGYWAPFNYISISECLNWNRVKIKSHESWFALHRSRVVKPVIQFHQPTFSVWWQLFGTIFDTNMRVWQYSIVKLPVTFLHHATLPVLKLCHKYACTSAYSIVHVCKSWKTLKWMSTFDLKLGRMTTSTRTLIQYKDTILPV